MKPYYSAFGNIEHSKYKCRVTHLFSQKIAKKKIALKMEI